MVPKNTTDPTTMGYYGVKYVSYAYKLHEDTKFDGKISTAGELVVKSQYMESIKENKKWYWEKEHQQQIIAVLK